MRKLILGASVALIALAVPAVQAQETTADPATGTGPQAPAGALESVTGESVTGEAPDPAVSGPDAAPPATTSAPSAAPVLTAEQKALYAAWNPTQRAEYDAWPNDYKVYYWTLNADQQKGYWALTPDQRGQIYKMTPEQRQIAWNSVVQQLEGKTPTTPPGQANPPGAGIPTDGVPDPQNAAQAARPAMPADPSYQGGPYKGALTPPPATAMDKKYPVCCKIVQDNCRNRGGV